MAEGLAQSWLENGGHKHWQAVSAGTFATEGAPTSKETLHALSQREIEFSGTSAPLTGEMIHSAHIVLCMTQSHMDMANQLAQENILQAQIDELSNVVELEANKTVKFQELVPAVVI